MQPSIVLGLFSTEPWAVLYLIAWGVYLNLCFMHREHRQDQSKLDKSIVSLLHYHLHSKQHNLYPDNG